MAVRIVLDTDVLVAGFASAAGASRRLLLAVLDREVILLLSTPLLLEYEAVLSRPSVLAMARASDEDLMEVLDGLAGLSEQVSFDYRWRPEARDPDDDLVLETAINGGAAVIASFNIRDMVAGASRFGIAVERPGAVLKRIRR